VTTDLVVLNGGSSSGKSTLARCLQALLPPSWLVLGVDDLIAAMPAGAGADPSIIALEPGGRITIGPAFREMEASWYQGIAAMARSGPGVIVDEVFLGGATSQARLRSAFRGLEVLWVGVRCEAVTATRREAARPDRIVGMAESQAELVHLGVDYDLVVDTTATSALTCARAVAAAMAT
jgi:chloramphenicol 3-O phosphotransferase